MSWQKISLIPRLSPALFDRETLGTRDMHLLLDIQYVEIVPRIILLSGPYQCSMYYNVLMHGILVSYWSELPR